MSGVPRDQNQALIMGVTWPPSVDVLAAQVRSGIAALYTHDEYAAAMAALDALVARVTEAERQLSDERFNSRSLTRQLMEKHDALADARNALERTTEALDKALGLAHFNTLDSRTYAKAVAVRDDSREVLACLDGSSE